MTVATPALLLGNLISLTASGFMAASCLSRNNRRVFFFQSMECLLLAVASVFFRAYAAVITMLFSAARNWIVSRGKYSLPVMIGFLLVTTALGLAVNVRGVIGLLPVLATAQYAICSYALPSVLGTKYNILINQTLWVIYSFWIWDISTAVSNFVMVILDILTIFRLHRAKRNTDKSSASSTSPLP